MVDTSTPVRSGQKNRHDFNLYIQKCIPQWVFKESLSSLVLPFGWAYALLGLSRSGMTVEGIVEKLCGEVHWTDCNNGFKKGQRVGYFCCPGIDQHTSETRDDHTAIFFEQGFPFITCFHSNCHSLVKITNARLRSYIEDAISCGDISNLELPKITEEKRAEFDRRSAVIARVKANETKIIGGGWDLDKMVSESEVPVDSIKTPGDFISAMFDPSDIVWCGEPNWTGNERSKVNFRQVQAWKKDADDGRNHWPQFTCGSTFLEGTFSRCNTSVVARKYLIVEHDSRPKAEIGGVFRWAKQNGLPLAAVVDSGNKSIHGWFRWEGDFVMEGWVDFFSAFGCDRKTMRPTQPVRLARATRRFSDGRPETIQKLLFLGA